MVWAIRVYLCMTSGLSLELTPKATGEEEEDEIWRFGPGIWYGAYEINIIYIFSMKGKYEG